MKQIPVNIKQYKRTPVFTESTIPQGLLYNHSIKEDTWGVINIIEGMMEYYINNSKRYILIPSRLGIIEPKVFHHIKPLGEVSFFIEFYK